MERLHAHARSLKRDLSALIVAVHDPRTPWYAKAVVGLVLGDAFSPLDLIPDPIPVLGFLDDLVILPLGIALAIRLIPAGVMRDAREAARERANPVSWAGTAVIPALWVALLVISVRLVARVA